MTTRIGLCLLGCGKVARLHSRIARRVPGVELYFASRSAEKAEAYRRRYGGRGAFGSYERACASPDVDAVFVCTPPSGHVAHARLAAGQGKALLIEKPVARSLAELSEIESAVQAAGVIAMVAENYFFKPAVRVLREHLQAGDIGTLQFLEINRAARSRPTGWRTDPQEMGGGALLEGGVHWVNYLCSLGGAVREVLAARPMTTEPSLVPVEDGLEMLVRFESGAVGKLLHAWNIPNRLGGLQLSKAYGSLGSIVFESNGVFAAVVGRRKRLRLPGLLDLMGYRAMLLHFVQCLRERRAPDMSLAVARRDLAIVDAAYRSLASGRFERPES